MSEQATRIIVTPANAELPLGETLQLSVELLNRQGESVAVDGSKLTFQSSNTVLAQVSATGLVTASNPVANALNTGGTVEVEVSYPYGGNGKIYTFASLVITAPPAYSGHAVLLSSGKDGYPQSGSFGEVSVFPNQPWSGGSPVIGG